MERFMAVIVEISAQTCTWYETAKRDDTLIQNITFDPIPNTSVKSFKNNFRYKKYWRISQHNVR